MGMSWRCSWRSLAVAGLLLGSLEGAHAQVTVKAVMHSDVKIVDPIWTTASPSCSPQSRNRCRSVGMGENVLVSCFIIATRNLTAAILPLRWPNGSGPARKAPIASFRCPPNPLGKAR